MATTSVWIGTFPGDGPGSEAGTGEGIWKVDITDGRLTGELAVRCPAPAFLASVGGGHTLFAVSEAMAGNIGCFEVTPSGGLIERQRVRSGGRWPCHITVHPSAKTVYVTNFHSGSLGVFTLEEGYFAPEVMEAGGPVQGFDFPAAAAGPDKREQHGSRLHSSGLSPCGEYLLVADLGTDELRRFRIGPDGLLGEPGVAYTHAPGTGPRHFTTGPGDHVYVVGELSETIDVLAWDRVAGIARHVRTIDIPRSGRGEVSYPAHLVHVEGRLLVSVRGSDVLAEFTVSDDGSSVEYVGSIPAGGSTPRHFAVVRGGSSLAHGTRGSEEPDWIVTAAQGSGEVTCLPWGADDSTLPISHLGIAYPTCVLHIE